MNLKELKLLVDYAIDDCQRIIQKDPKTVLSEGDLERLLSDCISKRIGYISGNPEPNEFAVHSQITHYNNESEELDARVDILLAKPADIISEWSIGKKFKIFRSADSFAIELKYRHDNNSGCVSAAIKDIKKYIKYKEDSYYYFIILLDHNASTADHMKAILDYYEKKKGELDEEYKNKFFCRVLVKELG